MKAPVNAQVVHNGLKLRLNGIDYYALLRYNHFMLYDNTTMTHEQLEKKLQMLYNELNNLHSKDEKESVLAEIEEIEDLLDIYNDSCTFYE